MTDTRRPFSVEDLHLHQKITSTTCLLDGSLAICSVRSVDRNGDKYVSRLWAFRPAADSILQLTSGTATDSSPKLAPSGDRVAFISNRTGSTQIHLLDLAGGEARQLGSFDTGVSSAEWCADGGSLLVTAAVKVDPDQRGRRSQTPPEERKSKPQVAWRLPYKADGMGYLLASETHLFRVDAATGKTRRLTDGDFNVYTARQSPDGASIAYTRTRSGVFAHRSDLWICDADGGGHRQLTWDLASAIDPVWSPDGKNIALIGSEKEGDAQTRFWLCDPQSGALRALGSDSIEPASGESFCWRPDGSALQFVRAWRGRHCIAAISVPAGEVQMVQGPDRQLAAFAPGEQAVFYCVEHPGLPSELWTCRPDGNGERQLSEFNPWWRERVEIAAEMREFEVPDGRGGLETIEGWLLRARDAQGPGPLLNDAHGGPAAYALLDFDTNVFWQVLCSQGWAVLALNTVGSASYGPDFCGRLAGHWGEYDLPQHEAAIKSLQRERVCDERIALSGKSYGGFLSSYAVGESDVFKAAVVMAPVGNIETHYGTSDGGYYADPLYVGTAPRFDRELARKLSPMQRIEKARTATLFLQGADDERCPKCQSEELFVSMLRAGRATTELVLYPGEDHHFLGEGKPSCREDAAGRVVEWVTEHACEVSH